MGPKGIASAFEDDILPSVRSLALAAVLAASPTCARAVEAAARLPAVRSFASWLAQPQGGSAAAAFDARLSGLSVLAAGTAAADAAALPLAEQFERMGVSFEDLSRIAELPEERGRELVRDAAIARAAASPYVRESILEAVEAGRAGKLSVESLQARRELWAHLGVYGAGPREALRELGKVIEGRIGRRLEPLMKDPFERRAPEAVDGSGLKDSVASLSAPGERATGPAPRQPPPPRKKSDLAARAGTAAVLAPGLLALVWAGGAAFVAFATALSALMALEYGGMLAKAGKPADRATLVLASAGAALGTALGLGLPALAAAFLLVAAREVLRKDHSLERLGFASLGLVLYGFLPAHLALLRLLPDGGFAYALLVVVSAFAVDTAAMAAGKTFGRRKLAPYLSPNKTWEGAIAGFMAALAVAGVFAAIWPGLFGWAGVLGFAAVMGALGQLSGLLSSMIKRALGAKDSGALLPGHGGFIDRFDSYLLAAAAAYALAVLL